MSRSFHETDLAALNTATKYPSIETYHPLDPRNGLLYDTDGPAVPFPEHAEVVATEKIDGTNARVIVNDAGEYLIGSREGLLYADGDLLANPTQGIVEALLGVAPSLVSLWYGAYTVYYLEVYGAKITGGSREYTGSKAVSHRLLDVACVQEEVLSLPREIISRRRDAGEVQDYLGEWSNGGERALQDTAVDLRVDLAPRVLTVTGADLPTTIEDTAKWLVNTIDETQAAIDGGAGGRPEGLVVRTEDRSAIAKVKFRDYERTLRKTKASKS